MNAMQMNPASCMQMGMGNAMPQMQMMPMMNPMMGGMNMMPMMGGMNMMNPMMGGMNMMPQMQMMMPNMMCNIKCEMTKTGMVCTMTPMSGMSMESMKECCDKINAMCQMGCPVMMCCGNICICCVCK